MSEFVYVYLMRHPYLKEGYIGVSNNPPRRFKEHLRDKTTTLKTDWLSDVRNDNLRPQLEILLRVSKNEAFAKEKELTRQHLIEGWKIMNSTNRGIGGSFERVTEWQTLME